jgi:hypothetical protein
MQLLRLQALAKRQSAPPDTGLVLSTPPSRLFRFTTETTNDVPLPPPSVWGLFYWHVYTQGEAHG